MGVRPMARTLFGYHLCLGLAAASVLVLGGCDQASTASTTQSLDAAANVSSAAVFGALQNAWRASPQALISLRALSFDRLYQIMAQSADDHQVAVDGLTFGGAASQLARAKSSILGHGQHYATVGAFLDDAGINLDALTAADFQASLAQLPDLLHHRGQFAGLGGLSLEGGDGSGTPAEAGTGSSGKSSESPANHDLAQFPRAACRTLDGITASGLFGVGVGTFAVWEHWLRGPAAGTAAVLGALSGSTGLASWWGCEGQH